jgi:mannose-6-phosphate isomerase-like protein (cupin superfamily)
MSGEERGINMTLYRWDSIKREFAPSPFRKEMLPADRVPLKPLRIGKGERVPVEVATGDLFIRMLEGTWRMQIANRQLTVRHNEAVIIPSGFSHSAEAIEDSVVLRIVDDQMPASEASLWAV